MIKTFQTPHIHSCPTTFDVAFSQTGFPVFVEGVYEGNQIITESNCEYLGAGTELPTGIVVHTYPGDPTQARIQLADANFDTTIEDVEGNFTGYDQHSPLFAVDMNCVSKDQEDAMVGQLDGTSISFEGTMEVHEVIQNPASHVGEDPVGPCTELGFLPCRLVGEAEVTRTSSLAEI